MENLRWHSDCLSVMRKWCLESGSSSRSSSASLANLTSGLDRCAVCVWVNPLRTAQVHREVVVLIPSGLSEEQWHDATFVEYSKGRGIYACSSQFPIFRFICVLPALLDGSSFLYLSSFEVKPPWRASIVSILLSCSP